MTRKNGFHGEPPGVEALMYSGHVITRLIGIWFKPLSHSVRRAGKSPFIAEDDKDVLYQTRDLGAIRVQLWVQRVAHCITVLKVKT